VSGKRKQQSIAAEHAPFVRTFTFSDGSTMQRCTLCSYGIEHEEQNPPIYTSRHYDTPVDLEPADHEEPESLDSIAARLELLAPKPEPEAGVEDESDWEDEPAEADDPDEADAELDEDAA
jgi:hypothetical protein